MCITPKSPLQRMRINQNSRIFAPQIMHMRLLKRCEKMSLSNKAFDNDIFSTSLYTGKFLRFKFTRNSRVTVHVILFRDLLRDTTR